MKKKVREIYIEGQERLAEGGVHDAAFDARSLLSFVSGIPFRELPLRFADELTDPQQEEYSGLIDRRLKGEPLQYITGEQEFMGLSFHVDPRVLIPRLDTEILAEIALDHINEELPHPLRVLDMCCGSGAIGLSLAALAGGPEGGGASGLKVFLSDVSRDALDVAEMNAEALGIADRVEFVKSDLFGGFREYGEEDAESAFQDEVSISAGQKETDIAGPVRGGFDLIVCNPPYIRSDVIPALDREVKDHEPELALDGGADGLDIYRRIADEAPGHLKPGGRLMLEIGCDQADDVVKLLERGFRGVRVINDLAGMDRVVTAARKG